MWQAGRWVKLEIAPEWTVCDSVTVFSLAIEREKIKYYSKAAEREPETTYFLNEKEKYNQLQHMICIKTHGWGQNSWLIEKNTKLYERQLTNFKMFCFKSVSVVWANVS